ncbi:MAG: zf-HC2 domain-containing protein [Clostridia bacterium]|nr:zf-HC2 domain-containing protein [Clostridia bacterium]
MDCNIIKDLIPLYIDDCCSSETSSEVEKHLSECKACKAVFGSMKSEITAETTVCPKKNHSRINDWKASILQSALLFASFLLITFGVALEAETPSGFSNGIYAFNIVIPATGFMLSLANWYFVKLYPSRRFFSWCSCGLTLLITLGAAVWTIFHYEMMPSASDIFHLIRFSVYFYGYGIAASFIFAVLSKVLSSVYAKMLGKE